MRKLVLFILLFSLVAVACNQPSENGSGDADATQETAKEEAPRVEITATPTLPPTFTPEVDGQGGHISPVKTRAIHIVQSGETMNQIASKYGVDMKFLADSNRIYNYHLIHVGDLLYIPDCE
ncbi:MAG: LysM peptidoglycan-binding domain-containing protein [Chloroflexi bacterium]|nr:LysM peptidoglycan-binding domain-containing protein [Chloroflexota bacterium]